MGQVENIAAPPGRAPEPRLHDPCAERGAAGELLHPGHGGLDVFLAGTVFMDMIFTGLPGLPPPGTELITDGLGSAPGGIANIAVAMKPSSASTWASPPPSGTTCSAPTCGAPSPSRRGSGWSSHMRLPGWPTPVTVSLAYDADRSMVTYHRPMPVMPEELITAPPAARTCFLDIDHPVPDWARDMRGQGTTVVADVGWDSTETWSSDVLDRLDQVDVFLPNAIEAMAYTRTATPELALAALSERVPVVVVKRGGDGAIAIDGTTGERAEAAALPVEALDPTGAGDVFGAGFVYGTLAQWPLLERLRFANLCSRPVRAPPQRLAGFALLGRYRRVRRVR